MITIRKKVGGCNECLLLKHDEAIGYICNFGAGKLEEDDDFGAVTPVECPLMSVKLIITR